MKKFYLLLIILILLFKTIGAQTNYDAKLLEKQTNFNDSLIKNRTQQRRTNNSTIHA